MKHWMRCGLLAGFAVALFGGATSGVASTTEACSSGRPFCVSITDTDGVSPSTGGTRYRSYALTIRNTGTSRLTNGRVKLTLTDVVGRRKEMLKIKRIRARVRAYELAQRVGLSESTLSRIETGRKQPSAELAKRIDEALSAAGSPADRVPA